MLNNYILENITPKDFEKKRITDLYDLFNRVLGFNKTFMSGSCARYTHTSPPKDLDIIYILNAGVDAKSIVEDTAIHLKNEIKKYTSEDFELLVKDTAIEVIFQKDNFSVDIVPAYQLAETLEGNNLYQVYVKRLNSFQKSDPKGYIHLIKNTNELNNSFRPTVRLIKKWKSNLKEFFPDGFINMKSFHIENIFVEIFDMNPGISIYEAVELFLSSPENFMFSRFIDRADVNKKIDDYIDDVDHSKKQRLSKIFSDNLIVWRRVCEASMQEDFDKWMSFFIKGTFMTTQMTTENSFTPPAQHAKSSLF